MTGLTIFEIICWQGTLDPLLTIMNISPLQSLLSVLFLLEYRSIVDPDPLVKGMAPDPDSAPDPSHINQK